MLDPARAGIASGKTSAVAWRDAVESVAGRWESLEDDYMRQRAEDVREVGRRVLAHLLGQEDAPALLEPGVVVAADLAPGETAELDPEVVRGIATARGGPTSHGAILARALGVPAVVAAGDGLLALPEGTMLLVDGDSGQVQADPPADLVAEVERRRHAREAAERVAWERAASLR